MIYAVPSTLRCHRLTALLLSRSQSEGAGSREVCEGGSDEVGELKIR